MKIVEIKSQKTVAETLKTTDQEFHKIICPDGIVWFPVGINPDRVYNEHHAVDTPYNHTVGSLICQKLTEGKGLIEISKMEGFPNYATILKWKKKPEFSKMLNQAFKDKAEYNSERAIALANAGSTNKVLVDTLKWSASSDNPDRFAAKKPTKKTRQDVKFIIHDEIQDEKK